MPSKVHFIARPLNEREIPDTVQDKVLARTYLEMAYSLEAEVAPAGWDQPAQLLLLRTRARQTQQGAEALVVDGTQLPGFHQVVHNHMRVGNRMHHALLHVAEAWASLSGDSVFRKISMSDVQGVALIHEGWALVPSADTLEEYNQVAADRQVHQHPDRVEVRMVFVCGPDGMRVGLNQVRDGVPMHLIGQARPGMHPREYQLAGDVPNALQYLLETIQGRQPGDWDVWEKQYDYDQEDLP